MSVCHTDFYYWPFWNDTTKNNGSRVKGALDHPIIPNKTCKTIFVSINLSFFSFIYFLFVGGFLLRKPFQYGNPERSYLEYVHMACRIYRQLRYRSLHFWVSWMIFLSRYGYAMHFKLVKFGRIVPKGDSTKLVGKRSLSLWPTWAEMCRKRQSVLKTECENYLTCITFLYETYSRRRA